MNIGIIGLGLIGGSMAKSFKANTDHKIYGYDISEPEIYAALLYEAIDLRLENISECDAVIVCVSPGAAADFIRDNAAQFKKDALIIDCCGVKQKICADMYNISKEHGFTFIGGHPMAGKQFSGFKASSRHLFEGSTMLLTPYDDTPIPVRETARDLFISAGFKKICFISPELHDRKIAYTSQLAHVVSNAYVKSPALTDCKDISAGSFRDLTRVARLNAPMWTELFLCNAENLGTELDILIGNLTQYRDSIKNKDAGTLESLLRDGSAR